MKKVVFSICVILLMLGVSACAEEALYIDEYDDCTIMVYENSVWAQGGKYGEKPVKLLDNIERLEAKCFGEYGNRRSYYAITDEKKLYVWGAHGFYTNMSPSLNVAEYTYVSGMLGLRCNSNVAPVTEREGMVDPSDYDKETENQKIPVKLLGGVEELVFAPGGVFAICTPGDVYVWGNKWGTPTTKSPRLINKQGKKLFATETSPMLDNGRLAVLEADNSLTFYTMGEDEGRTLFESVKDVCTAMYPEGYVNAVLVLDGSNNKLYESSNGKITLAMDNVHSIKKTDGRIYIMQKDGVVYERVYENSAAQNILSESEDIFDKAAIRIYVDGKMIETDSEPYIKNNRTMVPLRAIFEALGAEVSWDEASKDATAIKGDIEIIIDVGAPVLYKNGEIIALDAGTEIKNDRVMVPVRAISEAFGCTVKWDNETMSVNITTENRHDFTHLAPNAEKVSFYWKAKGQTNAKKVVLRDEKTITKLLTYLAKAELQETINDGVWYEDEERLEFSVYIKADFGHNIIHVMVNDTEAQISANNEIHSYSAKDMAQFKKGIVEIFD